MGNQVSRNSYSGYTNDIDPSEYFLFEGIEEIIEHPPKNMGGDPLYMDGYDESILELKKAIIMNYRGSKNYNGEVVIIRFMSNLITLASLEYRFENRLIILFALCAYLSQDDVLFSLVRECESDEQKQKFLSVTKAKMQEFKDDERVQHLTTFLKNIDIVIGWFDYNEHNDIKEPE